MIAKTWTQPRCASESQWINITMEYYSEIKINELSSYKKKWSNLKWWLQSKRSQRGKFTFSMILTIWISWQDKNVEIAGTPVIPQGFQESMEEQEGRTGKQWVSSGHWNYSVCYCSGGYMTLCICQNPQNYTVPNVSLKLTVDFN